MDRLRLSFALALGAAALVTGVHVALSGHAMVCEANGCYRPGPSPAVEGALTVAGMTLFALAGGLAVRAFRPSVFAFRCAIAIAVSAGVLILTGPIGGPSGCSGGPDGMTCYESPAAWVRVLGQAGVLGLAAGLVGALVGRLFSTAPGSPARARGLRLAIGALALCFLVPALLSLRAPTVPDGVEWQVEGRQVCARWTYPTGYGESCRALSGIVVTPIALVAGASGALKAGRPAWRWTGWLAVALGASTVGIVVAMNVGSSAKTAWLGFAAVTAGLALACWLLDREAARPA